MTAVARPPLVAVVDYGMGNLFSVKYACERVGMSAIVTSDPAQVLAADGVVLPGVGAFGDAIATLRATGLAGAVVDTVAAGRPLFGICLGMQLLFTESHEFGRHDGLGLIAGEVRPLSRKTADGTRVKVPHMGWSPLAAARDWDGTPLAGLAPGRHVYFVHSFVAEPAASEVVLATTAYADDVFCSSVASGAIFACQFHPERSGPAGLSIYVTFSQLLRAQETS